jgi:protein-S-isoprenylcysteine O-methyltransferase Ste14
VAQFALMAVLLAAGAVGPRWPDWLRALGAPVALAGAAGAVWAFRALGDSLTPYPRPRAEGRLVESGPYALVRHPMYGAGLLFLLGYALFASVAATAVTVALAALWWGKSRVEERHLAARFPEYGDYRRRVRSRLLPFL